MSIAEVIEKELRVLANEAKKNSGLKDPLERTIAELRTSSVLPVDQILSTLSQTRSLKLPRVHSQCVSVVQRMLGANILDSLSTVAALDLLYQLLQNSDESVQLKVIQTVMLVLNPSQVILTEELEGAVWKILMELEGSRSALSRNTGIATLRQLINVSFDKLKNVDTESFEGKGVLASCSFLFRNVLELAGAAHKQWKTDAYRQRTEGLDMLINLLRLCQDGLPDQFVNVLEKKAEGLLRPYLVEDSDELVGQRSIECAVLVVKITKKPVKLIENIALLATSRRVQPWQLFACLNALKDICGSPDMLMALYLNGVVQAVINSLNILSHESFAREEEARNIRVVAEIVSKVIESVSLLVERAGLVLGEMAQFPVTEEQGLVEKLLIDIWRFLLPVMSMIATHCWEEELLQIVLSSYQSVINISGTLNCSVARESFLGSLAQLCLPAKTKVLSSKNIYTCKTMFNITHCLGCILDVKAWHKVLDVLYRLDYILNTSSKSDDGDMEILSSALESLFTNTQTWSDSTLIDLLSALGQLTLEFMESLATNEQKLAGMKVFGLEKMIVVADSNLERVTLFWEMLGAYLDCICNSKYPEIRVLGINSQSRIMIKVFKHFVDYPPPASLEKWKNWQRTLFLALHDLSASGYSDTQEAVFQSIFSILQTCGGQLDRSGWSMLLFVLSKMDHTPAAFKCLQLVISDYLHSPHLLPSIERLISCISKFAYQTDDMSQAISAVGMYWNLADYVGRVGKEEEQVWWLVLGELKILGEDERPEVRHSAIQSLHVALTTHGSCLSGESWQKVIHDVILSLLQKISTTYFQHATLTQEIPILEPPNFTGSPKAEEEPAPKRGRRNLRIAIPTDSAHPIVSETPKFAGRSEKIMVHHSSDTLEKQWEETYHIFTQNLGKIFRVYLASLTGEDSAAKMKSNWDILMLRLKQGIHNGTTNIILAVLRATIELLNCEQVQSLFFSIWNSSWELFTTLSNRLQVSQINLPSKLITTILENLNIIMNAGRPEPFRDRYLNEIFILVNCLLDNSKHEATLSKCKLLLEQREIFNFLEQMGDCLLNNQILPTPFLNFVLKYCKYDTQDSHSDAICRRALELMCSFAGKAPHALEPVSSDILQNFLVLLTLRFNNEAIMLMNVTSKGAPPLWVVVADSFLKMIEHLMTLDTWDKLCDVLQELLNPSEKMISQISKPNLEEIVKLGEPVDIQIMEFVIKTLIPGSMDKTDDLQWRLIKLLDTGCDNFYRTFHAEDLSYQHSLSAICLNGLFQLSSSKHVGQILPVLISRCKDLLVKFANEEKLMGQMPLPKGRLVEILEVLQCLKTLDIPNGVLERPGPKAHLFELFPQLCELITAKEPEVKEELKQVFLEITKVF